MAAGSDNAVSQIKWALSELCSAPVMHSNARSQEFFKDTLMMSKKTILNEVIALLVFKSSS